MSEIGGKMAVMEGEFPKGNLMFFMAPTGNTDARLRVDLKYGYVSYSLVEQDRAMALFAEQGIRLRLCRDIFDDGTVIAGEPLPEEKP
jgi:hypothetical protein